MLVTGSICLKGSVQIPLFVGDVLGFAPLETVFL